MTVSTLIAKSGPYNTGGTGPFSYAFRILDEDHIRVVLTDASGTETDLTITTDYTVAGVGDANGGTVTLVEEPDFAGGELLTLVRNVPKTQETDLENQGGWYPEVIEDALDKLTMQTQDLAEAVERSVKVQVSDDTDPDDLVAVLVSAAADAVAAATAAEAAQELAETAVANVAVLWGGTVGGTADAITLTPNPAITAYSTGQRFRFMAASANTGPATVAVSGLAAKAIQRGGSALAANDILASRIFDLHYDGTQFQLEYVSLTAAEERTMIGALATNGSAADLTNKPASIAVSVVNDTTALAAAPAKRTFRMPFAMTLSAVRASLATPQTSGNIVTVDINEAGSSILSTKITVDNGEETSTTAVAAPVISDSGLADDAKMTIDIDQIGDGTAKGLIVYLIGTRA